MHVTRSKWFSAITARVITAARLYGRKGTKPLYFSLKTNFGAYKSKLLNRSQHEKITSLTHKLADCIYSYSFTAPV